MPSGWSVYNGEMRLAPAFCLAVILLFVAACHKEPEPDATRVVRMEIWRAQRRLQQIDTKLKDNIDDIGLKNMLNEEQELVKSRLARLEHDWPNYSKDPVPVWDGHAELEDQKGFSKEQHEALKSARRRIAHTH